MVCDEVFNMQDIGRLLVSGVSGKQQNNNIICKSHIENWGWSEHRAYRD